MEIGFHCEGMNSLTPRGWVDGGVGVFLHGQAEGEAGFDIPASSVNLATLADGEHPAALNGNSGYTLFLWRNPQMLRGLVAKNSDVKALEHARSRFKARSVGL